MRANCVLDRPSRSKHLIQGLIQNAKIHFLAATAAGILIANRSLAPSYIHRKTIDSVP